ncbi:MAG: hypothetical protein IT434_15875 [Phycisphaerales bacterium]|jgi:hypothetical protein|nr:hypothetical protein [Phycisphaerales bacterium]
MAYQTGTAHRSTNPCFDVSDDALRAARRSLAESPANLPRPLVVLAGWRSPPMPDGGVLARLGPMIPGARDTLSITYASLWTIESAARRVVARVQERFPQAGTSDTTEVDVIAISMGGLVARLAASDAFAKSQRRLRIARLFTLATPHRGARLASLIRPDPAAAAMRPGSEFLRSLDDDLARATFDLTCYAQLRDWWVGARNTSPPGRVPIWCEPRGAFGRWLSHFAINFNPRVLTDGALRLRGMTPLSREGAAPPTD